MKSALYRIYRHPDVTGLLADVRHHVKEAISAFEKESPFKVQELLAALEGPAILAAAPGGGKRFEGLL